MADWWVRHHRKVLALVAALTLASGWLLLGRGLRQDYRLEAFVASGDASYRRFRHFMETFTSNEVALIAVQTDDALSQGSTAITNGLLDRARSLQAVQRADAITTLPPWLLRLAGQRLTRHRLIAGNLLSSDGRTAAILLQMRGEDQGATNRRQTVAQLREIVSDARRAHPDTRIILAGPYVTLMDMYDYVDRDLLVFCTTAFALIGLTLWVVFRRPGPMLFAMGVGLSSTLCALGLAVTADFPTSLITQMVVILVAVLAVAGCVHLAVAGEETADRCPDASSRDRARKTLGRLWAPCSAVVLTTAAGFGSVCISQITPVRVFGVLIVVGLLISLAGALAGSVWLTGASHQSTTGRRLRLPGLLSRTGLWAVRRRFTVVLLFGALGLLSAAALGRLGFESDFVKNFRPHSQVRQSYRFIERHLSPVGSMEIVIRSKAGTPIACPENLHKARLLGDAIVEKHAPVRKAMTLADLTTLVTDALPTTDADLRQRLTLARRLFGQDSVRNFLDASGTAMRMNLRVTEGVSVQQKLALADDVRQMAVAVFGPGFEVEVTGLYPFYAGLVAGLVRDQYRSLGLTVPAVFVVMALVFRSWKVAAVAMVPNLLPVLFCLGAMGWTGIPVNMTTGMMLAVTMGIAVDDTIHYVWRYREELARTGSPIEAVSATSSSVGRACLFTTVVIAGGFWVLTLSQFLPTAYFGGLVGFTMLGTLAADLLLLPALLTWTRIDHHGQRGA
ncbi:MAG: RND family transporter [Phycisphaerae bacterium]